MKARWTIAVTGMMLTASVCWGMYAPGPRTVSQFGYDGFDFHCADASLGQLDVSGHPSYPYTILIDRDWDHMKTIPALGITATLEARFNNWSVGSVDEGYIWMTWDNPHYVQQLQYNPGYGGIYGGSGTTTNSYHATKFIVQTLVDGGDPMNHADWVDGALVDTNNSPSPWNIITSAPVDAWTRGVRMKMLDPDKTGNPDIPAYHMGQNLNVWASDVDGHGFNQLQTSGFQASGTNVAWNSAANAFSLLTDGDNTGIAYVNSVAGAPVPAEGHQMWWQFDDTELLGNVTIVAGGMQNACYWLDTELWLLTPGGDPGEPLDWFPQGSTDDSIDGVVEFAFDESVLTDGVKLICTDYYSDYGTDGQTLFGATEIIMLEGSELPPPEYIPEPGTGALLLLTGLLALRRRA